MPIWKWGAVHVSGLCSRENMIGDILELQRSDIRREPGHDADHFPGPQVPPGCPLGAAFGLAIVLGYPAAGVRGGADI